MSRGVIGPGDGPCPDCISRGRLVCPDRPYDGIVELLQTPATNLGVVPEARTCPKCCRQSATAQVMCRGTAPLPVGAGGRAGPEAACRGVCYIRGSALPGLDVTRHLPPG